MKAFRAPYPIAILLSVYTALMVACGSDTYYASDYRNYDKEFGRQDSDSDTDEEGTADTVRSLDGQFKLASFLEPVKLEISSLDKNLKKQESVTARIERNRTDFTYKVKEMLFTEPFVEFGLTCRFRDSKDTTEMQFRALAKLSDRDARNIDLYHLLESEYLKKLVQKEGESFDLARMHTHQAIHDMLEPEQDFRNGIRNVPYGNDTLETFTYLYCLFFLEDTTFYSNFRKIASAIGSGKKWDDILPAEKVMDKLTEYYRLDELPCDTARLNELKIIAQWSPLRYDAGLDAATWIVGGIDSCRVEGKTPKDTSKVADTTNTPLEVLLTDIFGECTVNRQNQKGMLDTGKYYQCIDEEWTPIMSPAYYQDYGVDGDIITHDGDYFRCDGGYRWSAIPKELIVPPVKDLQPCILGNMAQYDDKVYRCYRYYQDDEYYGIMWYRLPEDSIPTFQRNGLFCIDSTAGRVEQVDGTYWTCKHSPAAYGDYEYFAWSKLSFVDSVLYSFNLDHKDECRNGPKGTTVHWNEAISKKYSTQVYLVCDGSTLEWEQVGIAERDNYEEATFDGAVFVDDSTFRATSGNFTYTVRKRAGWAGIFDVIGIETEIDGKEYGAFFRNKVPYLSGKRGDKDIDAASVTGRSDNFENFAAQYTHPESAYPAFNVVLTHAGENSYMDWEQAAAFCPEGYHVPDTTEWTEDFLKNFPLEGSDAQDSPMQVYYNGKRNLYDIYWTSASKDSESHYCYEISSEGGNGIASRIIECPDNLYPGVQTLCFMDKGEE